ncbi:hypothetical protein PVK06_009934 [Gossypium arboreum]|uniref:ATPase F1/V1/A1 complex alpha/beta subunit N-terminal domain-containing protein n=1 Tax=Gossypium arboreum TaxID=29729 RepID=A0ABR0QPT0_GOSAR|nr:hypothetical protein PVK06_009934 [Gossypium arboreum]
MTPTLTKMTIASDLPTILNLLWICLVTTTVEEAILIRKKRLKLEEIVKVTIGENLGHISQIIGPVLNVAFSPDKMSNIYNALVVKGRDTAGQQINETREVQQLFGNNRVKSYSYERYR